MFVYAAVAAPLLQCCVDYAESRDFIKFAERMILFHDRTF